MSCISSRAVYRALALSLAEEEPSALLRSASDRKSMGVAPTASIRSVLAVAGALCNDGMADNERKMLLCCANETLCSLAATLDHSGSVPRYDVAGVSTANRRADAPYVAGEQLHIHALAKPPGWLVSVRDEADLDFLASEDLSQHVDEDSGEHSSSTSRDTAEGNRSVIDWIQKHHGAALPVCRDRAAQHGLVHRLDRDTSGVLLAATTYRGLFLAQLQFIIRRVYKEYVCLCDGVAPKPRRLLEAPLRWMQTKDGARSCAAKQGGQTAKTEILSCQCFVCMEGSLVSLVSIRLHTGRRHQIRAHMSGVGCPLIGDAAYGGRLPGWCSRIFLHACKVRIDIGDGIFAVCVSLPVDLVASAHLLQPCDGPSRVAMGTRGLQKC